MKKKNLHMAESYKKLREIGELDNIFGHSNSHVFIYIFCIYLYLNLYTGKILNKKWQKPKMMT